MLFRAARHVGLVTAVQAVHRRGALADRRAHAVHRGVAAADDDDLLAPGIQRAALEVGDLVAEAMLVRRRQIGHRRHEDRKSTRLNSSHYCASRMPSYA